MAKDGLSYAPTGLRRGDAAKHCGVSTGYFDKMVIEGLLPPPKRIGEGIKVWLRQELDDALFSAPTENIAPFNPCDVLLE